MIIYFITGIHAILEVILTVSSVEDFKSSVEEFLDSVELLFTHLLLLLLQGPPLMVSGKNAVAVSFLQFTSLNHTLQNNLKPLPALLEVAVVNLLPALYPT